MPRHRRKYPDELRKRAVRVVIESKRPVAQVARELGARAGAVRTTPVASCLRHRGFCSVGGLDAGRGSSRNLLSARLFRHGQDGRLASGTDPVG